MPNLDQRIFVLPMSILMFIDFESLISVLGIWEIHVCSKSFVFNVLINFSFSSFMLDLDQLIFKPILVLGIWETHVCSKSFVFNVLINFSYSLFMLSLDQLIFKFPKKHTQCELPLFFFII